MTRKIRILVAYDGTEFHGWQCQTGMRTVQDAVEKALRRVVRHPVNLTGSGRTDAGVHAAGHVSHFVTQSPLALEPLRRAVGSRLPGDVSIVAISEVHPDFHATRSAVSKLYRYRVHNRLDRPVEQRTHPFVYHFWKPLDLDRMRAAARHFVGEMDFTSMAAKGTKRRTMVRTVLRCSVERHLDEIRMDVEGTGFLYKQVRTMAGTLLSVGRGLWEPDHVKQILESRDRNEAGPSLPAQGLCLQWVRYPPHLLTAPERSMDPDPVDDAGCHHDDDRSTCTSATSSQG